MEPDWELIAVWAYGCWCYVAGMTTMLLIVQRLERRERKDDEPPAPSP